MTETPTLRPVRAGDELTLAVENGYVRRRAPSDGVVIEMPDREVFVPADELLEALRALGLVPPEDDEPKLEGTA